MSSFGMGTFCEIVKGSHVVFLFDRSWWRCGSAPMPSSLPYGNEAKEMILYPLVLPFFPTTFLAQPFCAVFQLLGGSHIRCVVVACFAEAVSNWTVIQFSNPGLPHDITAKQKKDYGIH